MIRTLKALGALMTIVAVLAVTASAAQATFTSAAYPATVTGTSTADVFDAFGSTVKCTNNSFNGNLSAASTTITVLVTFKNCKAFGLPATVETEGCHFLLHKPTGVPVVFDLVCSSPGARVRVRIYSSESYTTQLCELGIPAQSGKSGATLTNEAGKVKVAGTVGGLTAQIAHRTSISCPVGPEETGAKYTIQAAGIVLSGNNGAISVD